MRKTYTIDAANKPLGRLAVEIATRLRGKHKVDFAPHKDEGDFVVVKNIDKMKITGRKLKTKIYYRHSGYPGGLKKAAMEELIRKKGRGEIIKKAVWGMLPNNKLRSRQIKRLKIER